ncbi:unnamed protein product [Leptidea sinapis]|uniref:PEP5/VPS11 N-terminal domain-containing protein n=1 Tax=Leptidea sinapis TaxID=189913 RepID=A0A5E4QGR5_9NEOP|nr:unnamed protein product [Leptidea sinapis]
MAFLEWRRFTFFDVHRKIDDGKIAECLQDTHITVATSGNNHVILCDLTGWVHVISRSWEITSFKAYELIVTHAQQLPHDPLLVTIGNMIAVGFQDGSVTIFRGDIMRQRSGKMKTLSDTGNNPITGLAFKDAEQLFVVSRNSVMVCNISGDRSTVLDNNGAPVGCSVLADRQRLAVATTDAIYCYTAEGRGPCYVLEGEKIRLNWFRSYLVFTTNETLNRSTTSTSPKSHHVTILDIQNKFIVFSKSFEEIVAVITEWGSFYILTKSKEMIYLDEMDLQSKLSLLFKKNQYDVAIRIAGSQHYDAVGLTEIYKQYGDHLYAKYVKTIGWLETSYVIRKYLECRHLEPLVQYLEELHKKRFATEDHTTLLLTCYVKIDQHDQQGKLKQFINSKDKAIDFDVDVAIKVVRQVSVDDALSLAANHKRHDWYLKMIIEDKKDFSKALDYIAELDFDSADLYMKKYGWRAQVALYMREGEAEKALAVCRRRGDVCPRLWLDVLWTPPPATCLPDLLRVVGECVV